MTDRRVGVLAAVLAGLLVLQLQPAAQGADRVPGPIPADLAPPPGWTEEMYQSVAESTSSTVQQARERVAMDRVYEGLIAAAEERFPESFGGYEIHKTGATALRLDFADDPDGSLAILLEEHPTALRVSTARVDQSVAQLDELYDRALAQNEALIDRRQGEEFSSLFLDVENNRVVLGVDTLEGEAAGRPAPDPDLAARQGTAAPDAVPAPANEAVEAQPEWAGLDLVAEPVSAEPTACVNRDDCNSLRGGTLINDDDDGSDCTIGYTARDKVTAAPFVVTAAHCGRGFHSYSQGNVPSYYIGRADYALDGYKGTLPGEPNTKFGYDVVRIPETGPNVGIRPIIYYSRQQAEYPIYDVGTKSLHRAGVTRCFSGRTTSGPEGEAQCGTSGQGPSIHSYVRDGQKWAMDETYRFDSLCSLRGDSGGPVFNGVYLDGVLWGNTGGGFFTTCTFSNGLAYHLVETTAELLGLNPFLAVPPCSNRPPVTC